MNKPLVTTLKKWKEWRKDHPPQYMFINGQSFDQYEHFMDWWVKQAEEEGILDGQD